MIKKEMNFYSGKFVVSVIDKYICFFDSFVFDSNVFNEF